jgi:uncharacterized protein YuzE
MANEDMGKDAADTGPTITPIKHGWAARGKGWAVHGRTPEEARQHYETADARHREIDQRPFWYERVCGSETAYVNDSSVSEGSIRPVFSPAADLEGTSMTDVFGKPLQLNYDEDADVLYASIDTPQPAITIAIEPDVLLRYIALGDALVGVTLINFQAHFPCPPEQNITDHAATIVRDLLRKYRVVPEG